MQKYLVISLFTLLLGFSSGYYLGTEKKQEIQVTSEEKAEIYPSIENFFKYPILGRIQVKIDESYGNTIVMDAEPMMTLPETPDSRFPKGSIKGIKQFDKNEGFDGEPLYSQMFEPNNEPDWKESVLDIDGDGVQEKIMFNSLGMTSQPHIVRILKNNDVIFEFSGSVVGINEVYGNEPSGNRIYPPGFILTTQIWQDRNGYRVRYIIQEDGTIEPLWQQRHAGIEIES